MSRIIARKRLREHAAIYFDKGRIYVPRTLTHKDYDTQRWKDEL